MSRVMNFNAGPAALPLPALERAQRELVDFDGTGMSVGFERPVICFILPGNCGVIGDDHATQPRNKP